VGNNLLIKRNKIGLGVFAGRLFKKGETICTFGGKKTKPGNIKWRVKSFQGSITDVLQIGDSRYLELDRLSYYFNHSCNPNAGVCRSMTLFALRNIKKDEEVTYDYSTTIDESFGCQCGSKQCRGIAVDFFGLPLVIQRKYFKKNALPRFIAQKMIRRHNGICPCGSGKEYKECHGK
jgi:hypothetical protein